MGHNIVLEKLMGNEILFCSGTKPSISKIGDFQFGSTKGGRPKAAGYQESATRLVKKLGKLFGYIQSLPSEDGLKMLTLDYVLVKEG